MLLSFDFDGTLVHPPEILEPPLEFRRALKELRTRGATWVVNTGRGLAHAIEGLHEARLNDPGPDYLLLREQEIWEPDGCGGWRDCGDWNQRGRETFEAWHDRHRKLLDEIHAEWMSVDRGEWIGHAEDPAGLMGWDEAAIEGFVPYLQRWRKQHPELSWQRNGVWLRFCVEGYNKGAVLTHLAQRLGIGRKRVFAVGDGWNDLEMLRAEVAGRFAVPLNAVPSVRTRVAERGGWLLDRPASYGVAQALEQLLLEGW